MDSLRRAERHLAYFKIGALACERNPERDSWEHWKKVLGVHGYSTGSIRQWMRWHRCLGEHAEQAAPLMSKVISALCSGAYTEAVRVMAMHDMLALVHRDIGSEEAKIYALACLETAARQQILEQSREEQPTIVPLPFLGPTALDVMFDTIIFAIQTYRGKLG